MSMRDIVKGVCYTYIVSDAMFTTTTVHLLYISMLLRFTKCLKLRYYGPKETSLIF